MFDPKSIMEKRELQEPIPTSDPADFPRSEEVPEGCIVLEDLKDEWGCQVDFHTGCSICSERAGRLVRGSGELHTENAHSGAYCSCRSAGRGKELSKEKETPPLLLIHGGRDMLVPFNQSCQLYNYMRELGKEVTFYKIQDGSHGSLALTMTGS